MSGRAFIISCSDHYGHRLHLWDKCLNRMGYSTRYVTSDFDHTTKKHFVCQVPGCVQIPVLPYRKNLSVQRILSHRMFAKRTKAFLENEAPDIIVALLPPNFLAKYLADYKRNHPNVKLIFDIFDLWPETFPSGKAKQLLAPVFHIWAALRDRNLPAADFVTTECDLFREKLTLGKNSETVYLCAEPSPVKSTPFLPGDHLALCYLGSINNIIDIPSICHLISEVTKERNVVLHIIGKGEREQEFTDSAKAAGAEVHFHGAVYDAGEKQRIMDSCHFGLNIMKSSVCIGLSMKSLDYFRHGLPIINTIPADTGRLVTERNIGIQLDSSCAQRLISVTDTECLAMRQNAADVFAEHFSLTVVEAQLTDILMEVTRK